MSLYTKQGDNGTSSLVHQKFISKADDRFEVLGTLDELTSHIGLAKCIGSTEDKEHLSMIQRDLIIIMAKTADFYNREYSLKADRIEWLETMIDRTESSFTRVKEFVLPGDCEYSARLDVARTIARRAERRYAAMGRIHGSDKNAAKYLNRLSDFLYILARHADYLAE
ncbi:MAG: cob(I)yrinic acid a,c-diamide adenosyltransferase [Lachnospiraceae bacterium]